MVAMSILRGNPRKQLIRNLISVVKREKSSNVRVDEMTNKEIRDRIEEIKMWDMLSKLTCPMCLNDHIKLDSKSGHFLYLRCQKCDAHFWMSVSRSLGARLIVR